MSRLFLVHREVAVSWVFLWLAGICEIGFAVSLKLSHGFSRLWPTVVFCFFGAASLILVSLAMKSLPVGTVYAVWTGIGAAGTAVVGMLWLHDPATVVRIVSLMLIVGGVVGLNLAGATTH
jgi:quaternary ammonium compound-resistance protein SugE